MALKAKSLFLYNLVIDATNSNLPFRAVLAGPQLNAVIPTGYYSLTSLLTTIASAMQSVDPSHTYTVTANRTLVGGTQNRITIATSGTYLDLLFSTGTTAATSVRDLISFGHTDYTGSTTYTNTLTSGTAIVTAWYAKNYQPPELFVKNFGNVNVSTSGVKETVTWLTQKFIGVEFEHEPQAAALTSWQNLISWMIQQKPFDFTPEITSPSIFYQVTLDTSSADAKGLAFNMKEMLPSKPFMYTTGPMIFRLV